MKPNRTAPGGRGDTNRGTRNKRPLREGPHRRVLCLGIIGPYVRVLIEHHDKVPNLVSDTLSHQC